jgi:hypothetical protein
VLYKTSQKRFIDEKVKNLKLIINLTNMFSRKEFKDWDFLNWCRSKGLNSLQVRKVRLRLGYYEEKDITLKLNEEALDYIHSYDIFVHLWQDGFPLGICLDVNKDEKEAYKLSLKLPTPTFVIVAKEDYKENKEVLSFFWDIEDRLSEQDYEQISNLLREKFPNLALSNKFRPPNSWVSYSNSKIVWLKVGESYSKNTFLQHLNYFLAPLPEKEEKEKEEEIPTKCQLIENLYSLPFSKLKDFALEFLSYDAIINKKEHIFQRKCFDSKIHPFPYFQKALFNLQNRQDNTPSCRIIASLSKDELEDLFGSKFDSHPCENCYFNFSLRKPFYQFKKLTIPKGYEIDDKGNILDKEKGKVIACKFFIDSFLKINYEKPSFKIVIREGRELRYVDFASPKEISSYFLSSAKKFREFILQLYNQNEYLEVYEKGFSGYDFASKTWNILNFHYTKPRVSDTLDVSIKGKKEDFISILKDIVSLMTENKDFYLGIPLGGALNFLSPSDTPPVYLLTGLPETGKTLRLSLINFLVRQPQPLDFTTISEAFIKSQFHKIKAFICIDNITDGSRKSADRLTTLLYLNETSPHTSYIPLILASTKIKNPSNKRLLHLKIEEKNDELLEEYSKILQKILQLPCYGHLFKISNDLCQIKQMSNLPIEINPNLFSFKSNYMAFKSALDWWHSLCSYLDVNFNITQEDIMNFINENFSTQKEYILLSLLDYIHQKFLKGKSSIYWREIKQELGINDDIFKILLCNEWSYHDNGFGKKYPVLRITKNSPLYQLWKGIPIQETELISKILENKEIIESQTDYKFKVSDKEIKSLISNFINLCSNFNLSESFH